QEGLMQRSPRDPSHKLTNSAEVVRWLLFGGTLFFVTLVPLLWGPDTPTASAPSAAMTMAFVVMGFGTLLSGLVLRRDPDSGLTPPILKSLGVVAASGAALILATVWAPLQGLLMTMPLTGAQWLMAIGLAGVVGVVIEGEKWIRRSREAKNVIQLLVDAPDALVAKDLVMRPEVGIVDYTGGTRFGDWLEANATHAEVFTEKAGVNSVILDSAADLGPVFRNLSVSMTMYSGQMCTTPQNLFVPQDGIDVGDEHVSYDDVVSGFVGAIDGLLGDDARAAAILGAIKGEATLARVEAAGDTGSVLSPSRIIDNPEFNGAVVRTPVIVEVDAESDAYRSEMFGPIIYVVKTTSTQDSIDRATTAAKESGAITWLAYTNREEVMDGIIDAAIDGGVSVALNLTGGLFVNQSAAFSDFHVTGANPAGNASLTDPAFVASRFKIIGVRVEPSV
ncbi:MAG: aldehyde dehydrogenase family protein, partial [Proteobacteria bacterium]|nr:aldehyde dehydrogenase family protein [Pseudomonadota bacterium]